MRVRLLVPTGILSFAGLGLASTAWAQSAADVLETASQRYEQRLANIENYTLVQSVMGFEVTSYFEKRVVDGQAGFVLVGDEGDTSAQDFGEYYTQLSEFAEHAKLQGIEKVDDRECYALRIDDLSALDIEMGGGADEFTPKVGLFYIDRDDYLLRRMRIEGEAVVEGEAKPVDMEMWLRDYREVDGLVHPFTTNMTVNGLMAAMSDEDVEEARKNLAELKQKMEEMPEAQRSMMESMMKGQMERLEEVVNSGTMNVSVTVKELKVNAGPPN